MIEKQLIGDYFKYVAGDSSSLYPVGEVNLNDGGIFYTKPPPVLTPKYLRLWARSYLAMADDSEIIKGVNQSVIERRKEAGYDPAN